jgi:hypothetical protein
MGRSRSRPRVTWGAEAALWGGVAGVVLALVVLGIRSVTIGRAHAGPYGAFSAVGAPWLRLLVVAALALAVLFVGFFATRSTQVPEAGIVAGLLAGGIVGAMAAVITVVSRQRARGAAAPRPHALGALTADQIGRAAALLALLALLGTGLGALGALLGGRRAGASGGFTPPPYPYPYPQPLPPTMGAQTWGPHADVGATEPPAPSARPGPSDDSPTRTLPPAMP